MAAIRFSDVTLRRGPTTVLDRLDWVVEAGERWVLLGPNGSGKTTMLSLASAQMHPTVGTVEIIGHELGRVDVRQLKPRIAVVSAAILKSLEPGMTVIDTVLGGKHAALAPWWHTYDDGDRVRARQLLEDEGIAALADRTIAVCSEGERQHIQMARSLMGRPELLLLDEPAAGFDVGARERLVARLQRLAEDPSTPPMVFVTHHLEEVPPGFTHGALLRDGRLVAAGPLADVLTSELVTQAFGLPLEVKGDGGRWTCRAVPA